MPFGPARNRRTLRPLAFRQQFTTQCENDTESAMMQYRAGSYDPRTGRFLQKDPIVAKRIESAYRNSSDPVSYIGPHGTHEVKSPGQRIPQ